MDEVLPADDELKPRQLIAMQRLDDTIRAGYLDRSSDEAQHIERMVRLGKVPGALKRITQARRVPDPPSGDAP